MNDGRSSKDVANLQPDLAACRLVSVFGYIYEII